jgi:hypothetical protein
LSQGAVAAGQYGGKWPAKNAPIYILFPNEKSNTRELNGRKYLGTSEKCEILHGGRLEYLGQLLY